MPRVPQFNTEQRVLMVNGKARRDSLKAIQWDFKKRFPFSDRVPNKMTIHRNKKKFDKEGKNFSNIPCVILEQIIYQ